ncbi:hypothetical protein S83_010914 [Arachis hypogaea]
MHNTVQYVHVAFVSRHLAPNWLGLPSTTPSAAYPTFNRHTYQLPPPPSASLFFVHRYPPSTNTNFLPPNSLVTFFSIGLLLSSKLLIVNGGSQMKHYSWEGK